MSEIKAHLFPFSVDYEGPVKSKEYLSVEKGPNGQYETVILGRQLIGHSVSTSGITQGHVFKKDMFVDEQDQKESMPWKKTDTHQINKMPVLKPLKAGWIFHEL
ncbi:hypothetical protein AB4K20DRAFT_1866153 [Rhizopus microsporus]